jgi:hypothetical protein
MAIGERHFDAGKVVGRKGFELAPRPGDTRMRHEDEALAETIQKFCEADRAVAQAGGLGGLDQRHPQLVRCLGVFRTERATATLPSLGERSGGLELEVEGIYFQHRDKGQRLFVARLYGTQRTGIADTVEHATMDAGRVDPAQRQLGIGAANPLLQVGPDPVKVDVPAPRDERDGIGGAVEGVRLSPHRPCRLGEVFRPTRGADLDVAFAGDCEPVLDAGGIEADADQIVDLPAGRAGLGEQPDARTSDTVYRLVEQHLAEQIGGDQVLEGEAGAARRAGRRDFLAFLLRFGFRHVSHLSDICSTRTLACVPQC